MTPDFDIFPADEAVRSAALSAAIKYDRTGMANIAELKTRFGITTIEAIHAVRIANVARREGGSMKQFSPDLIARAEWFLSYAHGRQAELLSRRFKLPMDDAWALYKLIKGGATDGKS